VIESPQQIGARRSLGAERLQHLNQRLIAKDRLCLRCWFRAHQSAATLTLPCAVSVPGLIAVTSALIEEPQH
jgi:hypothetical protein